jgi:hypothetical protein
MIQTGEIHSLVLCIPLMHMRRGIRFHNVYVHSLDLCNPYSVCNSIYFFSYNSGLIILSSSVSVNMFIKQMLCSSLEFKNSLIPIV